MCPIWVPNFDIAKKIHLKNDSERTVARSLNKTLPENVIILPNWRWQKSQPNRAYLDLETDFLIIWPRQAIIILEVKGGEASYDPKNGQWVGLKSRSPTEQARASRNDICGILHETRLFPSKKDWRDITYSFICFPQSTSKPPVRVDGFNRENIFIGIDLDKIGYLLNNATKMSLDLANKLSDEFCEYIVKRYLSPEASFHPVPHLVLSQERKEIDAITQEQIENVREYVDNKYAFVRGPAGTGKTIIALSIIDTWVANSKPIYYITENPYLVNNLKEKYSGISEYIFSITDFSRDILKLDIPNGFRLSLEIIENMLLEAYDKHDFTGLNILIDEAQDLGCNLLLALVSLCKGGSLWVFYDDQQVLKMGQTVQSFQSEIEKEIGVFNIHCLYKRKNLRNTKLIAKYIATFVETGSELLPESPNGVEPVILWYSNIKDHDDLLKSLLIKLIRTDKYPVSNIVLITFLDEVQAKNKYISKQGKSLFSFDFHYMDNNSTNLHKSSIKLSSVMDFKGLEEDIVILADTDKHCALNPFYTGGSRAIFRLFVLNKKNAAISENISISEQMANDGFSFDL